MARTRTNALLISQLEKDAAAKGMKFSLDKDAHEKRILPDLDSEQVIRDRTETAIRAVRGAIGLGISDMDFTRDGLDEVFISLAKAVYAEPDLLAHVRSDMTGLNIPNGILADIALHEMNRFAGEDEQVDWVLYEKAVRMLRVRLMGLPEEHFQEAAQTSASQEEEAGRKRLDALVRSVVGDISLRKQRWLAGADERERMREGYEAHLSR